MSLCIIPARGGSKRISRKNIRDFCGKPIILWSIEAAINSSIFEKVIVSTDDKEISEIALDNGAEVPFIRPSGISDDFSNTSEVMSHACMWAESKKINIRNVCCLYPTAPFVSINDLRKANDIMNSDNWNFVFSAAKYDLPVFRSFKDSKHGGVEMLFPEFSNYRSQDLPDAFYDAGQFYFGKGVSWIANSQIFGEKSYAYKISKDRVQDIDTSSDWKKAERKFLDLQ